MQGLLALICLFTLSCGGKKEDLKPTTTDTTKLEEKYAVYRDLAASYTKATSGFVTDSCDSLLFTGLYYAVDKSVAITNAKDSVGKWHRRDLALPECYPDESASEISKDMYIGLLWGIWANRDLELLRGIIEYGDANDWRMGDGDPSRTVMSPALVSTVYLMSEAMGDDDPRSATGFPILINNDLTGFQAHLQVLHIALRGEMAKAVTEDQLEALKVQAERQPKNALFNAFYDRYNLGDQSKAIASLMDETQWPALELPSGEEHCEFWLWQRDDGADWEPCDAPPHSGADWLFAAKIILQ